MSYVIEDFIEQTNAAETRDEAFALYHTALKKLGFDRVVYTFVTDHLHIQEKAGHGKKSNYPEDWMDHYLAHDYAKIDPVVLRVLRDTSAFTWKCLSKIPSFNQKQLRILEEGREAGLHDGVGVPLYGTRGGIAGVGLASSTGGINPDRNMLSKLKLITEQFHLVYCSLEISGCTDTPPNLTKKEIEILKWWAVGKTSDEIAIITDCSAATIKFHVKNIYLKLDANSKILAVTKAIRLGLIPLDAVDV